MKAAALYLRSSKDRKDVSPDAQRRALKELAEQRGLRVAEEFVDAVESGKDTDRPGFQRLVAAVRNPTRGWDTVLMYDTARLSRRRVISLMFEELDCKQHGVTVIYKTLPDVDPLTEIVLKSTLVAWDEYHSISSKQKGLAGMGENVRAGFRAGGRAPTGYKLRMIPTGAVREGLPVTKSTLELDPEMAPAIARYLAARVADVPRKKAKLEAGIDLPDTTLISMEWNALAYAGHTIWNVNAERQGGAYVGGSKRRPRSEWLITRDTHQALIDDKSAECLLSRLEAQARTRNASKKQRARESGALLGGLMFTPKGEKWWAERDRYRAAGRSISSAVIDRQVMDQVLADISGPEFVPALLQATRASLANDTDPAARKKLQASIAALGKKIERMLDLASDLADPSPALRKIDAMEAERAAQHAELEQLEVDAEQASLIARVSAADVSRLLAGIVQEAKENGRSDVLRPLIASVVERVEVDPQTLIGAVCYRIAPETGVKLASPRGFEPRSPP